jgi:spermidine/putrescine-binding protein
VKVEERLEEEDSNGLQNDMKGFVKNVAQIWNPDLQAESPEELLDGAEWIQMPLARAVPYLSSESKYHFVLPEDGGAMELGLLAVGEKSLQPVLAGQLINELLSTDHAMEVHNRLGNGVVHKTLENVDSLAVWQRPQALRRFPLNRLRFPDLNIEVLPRFERLYDESFESEDRN